MSEANALRAGPHPLRRAHADEHDRVLALQRLAYARNRSLLGVEPLPLLADYSLILRDMEVWIAEQGERLVGALILEPRTSDLLLWSIAVDPTAQASGLGRAMLDAAEQRARQLALPAVRLYTGTPLEHLIGWYGRHGYAVERIEALSDRSITHMIKHLGRPLEY